MKSLVVGALAGTFALAVAMPLAHAADGSELMAQCKENAESDQMPPGGDADKMISFCECLVDKAGDNQTLIDEHLSVMQAPPDQRQSVVDGVSDEARANAQACFAEAGMTPPGQ